MAGSLGRSLAPTRLPALGAAPADSGVAPLVRLLPGVLLCTAISIAALAAEHAERALFGRAWLEGLLFAIILGAALRTLWRPGLYWAPGIAFCNKTVLEVVVLLLGASVSLGVVASVGAPLVAGVAVIVLGVVALSYGLGVALGLSKASALLVACGNAICGNSAIVAVAAVADATSEEVASALAFTAAAGVAVVVALPAVGAGLGLEAAPFGVFAGLTVYAVPQVLAATASAGPVASQIGALVKLLRVMMLGPIVLLVGLATQRTAAGRIPLRRLAPWFVAGFFLLATLRSLDLLPASLLAGAGRLTPPLTLLAMAGLGATVDLTAVVRAGPRLALAVTISILGLALAALSLITLVGLR